MHMTISACRLLVSDFRFCKIISPARSLSNSHVEPVFSSVLYGECTSRCTRGSHTPGCDDTVRLADTSTDIRGGLGIQLKPVDSSGTKRSLACIARRLDISRLRTKENLVDGAQVEGRCARGVEEVVAQSSKLVRAKAEFVAGGERHVYCNGWDVVERGFVGIGKRGGIKEGCDCARCSRVRASSAAGIILGASSNANV